MSTTPPHHAHLWKTRVLATVKEGMDVVQVKAYSSSEATVGGGVRDSTGSLGAGLKAGNDPVLLGRRLGFLIAV